MRGATTPAAAKKKNRQVRPATIQRQASLILDSGFVVASINTNDPQHLACTTALDQFAQQPRLFMPAACLGEVSYLLLESEAIGTRLVASLDIRHMYAVSTKLGPLNLIPS
ncbi:hypothetical protein WJX73_007512 [Symbiochloris irregularis]|uniref:PIN domain-containing protein n=1 Tax=Symbiochloris irregularis TaxID=706552 RepID=A0AAW1NYK8_9CHLO